MKVLAYKVRTEEKERTGRLAKKYGHDITMISEDFGPDTAHLAAGYEGLMILGSSQANKDALAKASALGVKYITTRVAGTDNIDVAACKKLGIKAAHVPNYSPSAVSEFTVGLILTLTRKICHAASRAARQNFSMKGLKGIEIRNRTIGVIGAGRIGFHVIKALSGFGCNIVAYDMFENDEVKEHATYTTLQDLYGQADIITLHCPLTDENYHMINEKTIAQMKDGVVIVNAARGALIDSKALVHSLETGKVGAAALDVYEHEAGIFRQDHSGEVLDDKLLAKLLQLPNVVITPHFAFYTDEAVVNMAEIALSNLKEYELTGICDNEIQGGSFV